MITRRIGLLLLIPLAAFLFAKLSHSQHRLPATLEAVLTEQAFTFLKNESNILITGSPPQEGLVPRHNGMSGSEFSGEERIAASLRSRESSLQHGKHYASIEITLNPGGIDERYGEIILHAVDNKVEHFTFDPEPSQPIPHLYEETTHHDFIFSVTPLSATIYSKPYSVRVGDFEYTLIRDITEPQLLNASQEEDETQKYPLPSDTPLKAASPLNQHQKQKKP